MPTPRFSNPLFFLPPLLLVPLVTALAGCSERSGGGILTAQSDRFQDPRYGDAAAVRVLPYPNLANIPPVPPTLASRQQREAVINYLENQNQQGRAQLEQTTEAQRLTNIQAQSSAIQSGLNIANLQAQVPSPTAPVDSVRQQQINRELRGQRVAATSPQSTPLTAGQLDVQQRQARAEALRQATLDAYNRERQRQLQASQQLEQARQREVQVEQQETLRQQALEGIQQEYLATLRAVKEPTNREQLFSLLGTEEGLVAESVIFFPQGGSTLSDEDKLAARAAGVALKDKGGFLLVAGHASPPPDGLITESIRNQNIEVSRQRAAAVANFLTEIGVPEQLIVLRAFADTKPVYPLGSSNFVGGNQRVEIYRVEGQGGYKGETEPGAVSSEGENT